MLLEAFENSIKNSIKDEKIKEFLEEYKKRVLYKMYKKIFHTLQIQTVYIWIVELQLKTTKCN